MTECSEKISSADLTPSSTASLRLFIPLIIASLIPLFGLPVLAVNHVTFNTIPFIGWMLFFGGVGHVASTAMFYADREAYGVMHKRPIRFYWLPLAVVLLCIAMVIFNKVLAIPKLIVGLLIFIHLCWLHFHYQKQSYGLIAFAAASEKQQLPQSLLSIVMLPTLAGGLAVIPPLLSMVIEQDTFLTPYYMELKIAGWIIYSIAIVLLLNLIIQHRKTFQRPMVIVFLGIAMLFYLPALVLNNTEFAFWSYALAHGFQYLAMLMVGSFHSTMPWRLGLAFILAAGGGAAVLTRLHGTDALLLVGVFINWLHFILDAKLWKMSEAETRHYVKNRYAFIFK